MKWLDSITDSVDANLSKPQEMVKDREAKRKSMGSQSRTRLSDPTTANRWKKRSAGAAFLFSNKDEIRKHLSSDFLKKMHGNQKKKMK